MKALVTGIINFKGGVGKTTSTINLAAGLNKLGQKVLVIDTDAQGNVTNSIGLEYEDDANVLTTASLMKDRRLNPKKAILRSKYFDFIPNNVFAYARTNGISDSKILHKVVEHLRPDYDHIIIDTPPYLGLDTANAIYASDILTIVTDFSKGSMTGIRVLMSVLDSWHDKAVAKSFKDKAKVVLFTKHQKRTRINIDLLEMVEGSSEMGMILSEKIPQSIKVVEDSYSGVPTVIKSPRTAVGKAYASLAQTWLTAQKSGVLNGDKSYIKI
jgi:chromosome partitioning protein